MFVLVIHDQSRGVSSQVPLDADRWTIGSADGNSVVLRRKGVEAEHGILERIEGGYKLVDLDTEHGTLVNGSYIAQKRLDPGDRIELGGCVLVFERLARSASAPVSEPQADEPSSSDPAISDGPDEAPRDVGESDPSDAVSSGAWPGPGARRRRDGGGMRAVRAVLYTVTAIVVLAGLASVLPGLLGGTDTGSYVRDRLALADIHMAAGKYSAATNVLKDLEREDDIFVDPADISDRLSRIDKALVREDYVRSQLEDLRNDSSALLRDKIARAEDLLEGFGNMPSVRAEIEATVAVLSGANQSDGNAAEMSIGALAEMGDTFLQVRNYVGARGIWGSLAGSNLATDLEVLGALRGEVDVAAAIEARKLLDRVDELNQRKDHLGALIVLDETELAAFRGTSSYAELDARALELEAIVGTGRMPGETPREPSGVTPERGADEGRESGAGWSKPPMPRADRGMTKDLADAMQEGDQLFRMADLKGALASYDSAMSARLGFGERARLARRIERANRAQWYLDAIRNYIEADPSAVESVRVRERLGEVSGKVVDVEGDALVLDAEGEQVRLLPARLNASSVRSLASHYRLSPEDRLNSVYYRMIDRTETGLDRELDTLLLKANEDPALKGAIDSAIAYLRALPEVPEWGFFRHDGQWLTFREREQARNLTAIESAVARLGRSDEDEYERGLNELRGLMPVAREHVVKLLYDRRAQLLEELQTQPELASLDRLFETRRELGRRRDHALELIFDTVKYFYPYKPPAVPPDKAALYPKVQQEVDDRVAEVREVWGDEFKESSGGTPLSKRFNRLLHHIRQEQVLLMAGDPDGFQEESELQVFKLLPKNARRVTVRNIALDLKERERLDRDVDVLARNASMKSKALRQESEQILITNCYRRMMGRQAVAINDKLISAARGHCEWMSRSGTFSHFNDEDPNLRTPHQRIRAQGYLASGSGENIAMIGGALAAHNAWLHSSGHHRNILYETHRDLGVGNMGTYWCQNFAGGGEFSGNLGD